MTRNSKFSHNYQEQGKHVPSHTVFNIVLVVLPNAIRKGNKRYTDWEGRNKTVFAHI